MPSLRDLPDNVIQCIGNHLELRSRLALARSSAHHARILKPSIAPIIEKAVDAAQRIADVLVRLSELHARVVDVLDAIAPHPDLLFDVFDGDGHRERSGAQEYAQEHLPSDILDAYNVMVATRTPHPVEPNYIDATIQLGRCIGDDYDVYATWCWDPLVVVFGVAHKNEPILRFVWADDEDDFVELDVGEALDPETIAMLSVLYDDHLRTKFDGLCVLAPLHAPNTPYGRVHEHDIRGVFHPEGVPTETPTDFVPMPPEGMPIYSSDPTGATSASSESESTADTADSKSYDESRSGDTTSGDTTSGDATPNEATLDSLL